MAAIFALLMLLVSTGLTFAIVTLSKDVSINSNIMTTRGTGNSVATGVLMLCVVQCPGGQWDDSTPLSSVHPGAVYRADDIKSLHRNPAINAAAIEQLMISDGSSTMVYQVSACGLYVYLPTVVFECVYHGRAQIEPLGRRRRR